MEETSGRLLLHILLHGRVKCTPTKILTFVMSDEFCSACLIKSRLNNLIALVEFLLKFTSNNGFHLFLNILLNFALNIYRLD